MKICTKGHSDLSLFVLEKVKNAQTNYVKGNQARGLRYFFFQMQIKHEITVARNSKITI